MKARLVESHRERVGRIESGEQKVIGQNSFTETEDSPLTAGADGGILTPDPEVERERVEALEQWKAERDEDAVQRRWRSWARRPGRERERDARDDRGGAGGRDDRRVGCCSCARAFGAYRAPTRVRRRRRPRPTAKSWRRSAAASTRSSARIGHQIRHPGRQATASTGTPTAPSRSPACPRRRAWR
jgi:(2R)-ethylmalonyl-CoA mutase